MMDRNDDDRSLRRIALRILNENEDQARDELDSVIQAVEDHVGRQASVYTWSVPVILTIPALCLLLSIFAALASKAVADAFLSVAIAACLIPLFMAWLWRRFQYGTGRLRKPREAIYANASDETRETLEKLFAYLQRESAPRAYYRNWRGNPIYLERRYFFGNLRALLLSEFAAVRALCLSPGGSRISGAIKIEKDPDEVIKELGIKPKRAGGPGRNAKYAYSDALISLIGDPRLSVLDLSNRAAAIRAIKKWLSDWFEEHADETGDVPRGDLLAPYAEKICAHLQKIASAKGR
ncbi:hypothetical protein [Sphingobium fuliginis]|uniref:Uncharacterized protein n=1 Tax=Sphingobium fuliginis ATCC 27551 TaxID=1208342 RepID=A0A5B8CH33_SPHSA|nr:hypothetical protein [Sphingobium fuliginis]QDC36041.1 hypothetical protein FIL70_01045 [Sphingobium fuliginis ATCC 27551]